MPFPSLVLLLDSAVLPESMKCAHINVQVIVLNNTKPFGILQTIEVRSFQPHSKKPCAFCEIFFKARHGNGIEWLNQNKCTEVNELDPSLSAICPVFQLPSKYQQSTQLRKSHTGSQIVYDT